MNKPTNLGRVQLRIMQILWREGRASARKITKVLSESKPIAHSTVQTLLRGLENKGSIVHETEGRTFVFRSLIEEGRFKQNAIRDLVERVFGGNAGGLMAHLMKHEKISSKEFKELRRLIDEQRGGKDAR